MCHSARFAVVHCDTVNDSSAKAFLALRARTNVFVQERRSGLLLFIDRFVTIVAAKSAEEGFNFFSAHDFSLLKAKSI